MAPPFPALVAFGREAVVDIEQQLPLDLTIMEMAVICTGHWYCPDWADPLVLCRLTRLLDSEEAAMPRTVVARRLSQCVAFPDRQHLFLATGTPWKMAACRSSRPVLSWIIPGLPRRLLAVRLARLESSAV